MVRVIEGKNYIENDPKGNGNYFELSGGSSYRGKIYINCIKEIHGKSMLVRVSARFELAEVPVIGS